MTDVREFMTGPLKEDSHSGRPIEKEYRYASFLGKDAKRENQ